MKKIIYGVCLLLAMCFVSNVYADDDYITLIRGESTWVETYDAGTCKNQGALIAFEVDGGCLFTNNLVSKGTTQNHLYHIDTATGDKYYIELLGTDPTHVDGYLTTYELVIGMNNTASDVRRMYFEDLYAGTGEDFSLNVGCYNKKFYFESTMVGATEVDVFKFDYTPGTRVISSAITSNDVTHEDTMYVQIAQFLFYFLVELDPTYNTAAKAIMNDYEKLVYVDIEDVYEDDTAAKFDLTFEDVTYLHMDFAVTLTDNRAASFVESYEVHSAEGGEEPTPTPTPEPTPDPTNPTQPNQPVPSPNTGIYISIIGVAALAVVGVVLAKSKKSKFNRI